MNCKNKDHATYRGKLIIMTELLNGDSKWQKVLYTYVADCKTLTTVTHPDYYIQQNLQT